LVLAGVVGVVTWRARHEPWLAVAASIVAGALGATGFHALPRQGPRSLEDPYLARAHEEWLRWEKATRTPHADVLFKVDGVQGSLSLRGRTTDVLAVPGVGYVEVVKAEGVYRKQESEVPATYPGSYKEGSPALRVYGLEMDFMQDGRVVKRVAWSPPGGATELETPLLREEEEWEFDLSPWLGDLAPGEYKLAVRYDPGRFAFRENHWRPGSIDLGTHPLLVPQS
jgi:hypothetical protein